MKKIIFLILLSLCILRAEDEEGIVVEITGFRNDDGYARITIFEKSDGFPSNPKKALDAKSETISNGKCKVVFTDIPAGTYAIAVLHDENSNEKMDTNALGIPKEGYGTSNNAKGKMGPPKFKDASFKYSEETITLKITMKYGI
ncbi:MAG: DUF2141 domain-containing protein [Candidatus Coatesbacteria bacterium]|nr:DUF2141 domain-containing protein [Candidatus Coatesbacteria bacterium]